MSKHCDWEQLNTDERGPEVETLDQLKAAKSILEATSIHKNAYGGVKGALELDRQPPRKFKQFDKAEEAER